MVSVVYPLPYLFFSEYFFRSYVREHKSICDRHNAMRRFNKSSLSRIPTIVATRLLCVHTL